VNYFEHALKFVLEAEGGYSNDAEDPGGATNFGITQRVYDAARESWGMVVQPVSDIMDAEVHEIYLKQYWQKYLLDDVPYPLNICVFDWAVNAGRPAIKSLQVICGAEADGVMGKDTLSAVKAKCADEEQTNDIVRMYLRARQSFYHRLADQHKNLHKFLHGWLNRVAALAKFVGVS
jgi:lysozyme family protein